MLLDLLFVPVLIFLEDVGNKIASLCSDHLSGNGIRERNRNLPILPYSRIRSKGHHLIPDRVVYPDTGSLGPEKFDHALGNGLQDLLFVKGRVDFDDRFDLADEAVHIAKKNLLFNHVHHPGQIFEGELAALINHPVQEGANKGLVDIETVHRASQVLKALRNVA
jgi:hypothetical protein